VAQGPLVSLGEEAGLSGPELGAGRGGQAIRVEDIVRESLEALADGDHSLPLPGAVQRGGLSPEGRYLLVAARPVQQGLGVTVAGLGGHDRPAHHSR